MEKPLSIKLHALLSSEFPNSSQNLAKFARSKKYKELKSNYRIYRIGGDLYIAYKSDEEWLCGAKLIRVACGYFETFASLTPSYEDVTEWFISEYSQKGMCAYTDMRHEWHQGAHEEELEDGETRTCFHCGKTEALKSKMVREIWWE
ncbi:hypothetical protein [Vibrio algicola]|uniref:Uncharacterized protein n=1 Tax=Vibrio algicola TaxID=2662262 RepID=A0A5Q0TIF7_9VIBR|nr:hypothetical protein [Vibrio algicola]